MYKMLWWKDARQFWPIWVFVALAAAIVQGLLLYYVGQDARHGALGYSALICASLYAFAAGAAAFAGEREIGTLRLLDILPADRHRVWVAKVSFALVTTLALTVVLLAMAALYTERWKPEGLVSPWEALAFAMIVVIALSWGLFWSAILSTALGAALGAIFCTAVSLSLLMSRLDNIFLYQVRLPLFVLCQLGLFLTTLLASVFIFARSTHRKWVHLEFRSPIIVDLPDSMSERRIQPHMPSGAAMTSTFLSLNSATVVHIATTDQRSRSTLRAQVQVLAWQTMKEGRKTWCLLTTIALILPMMMFLWLGGGVSIAELFLIGTGISIVAGVSTFGLENRTYTQRFLTHHGARPTIVWLIKLMCWCAGLVLSCGPLALMAIFAPRETRRSPDWLAALFITPLYLGVAVLSGMAIRRSITAIVIALVTALALTIPLLSMVVTNMLPAPGLLIVPAGLLAISWAWSGDWLLSRPAPGRWVRLGLLIVGMITLDVSLYAGYRAWGIRDVGPIAPPEAWLEPTMMSIATRQNAADLYREAGLRLSGPLVDKPESLDRNRKIPELLRRATKLSYCRFLEPRKLTSIDRPDLPPVHLLAHLLSLEATERQVQGNLAGAWDDIMALFRMAHQVGEGSGYILPVLTLERQALGSALEWAVAHGQTTERLHAALVDYRSLPKISINDIIRAEASLVEKTLDLPVDRLRDWAFERVNVNSRGMSPGFAALFDLVTMPWERVRARRVNRLIAHAVLRDTAREPWERMRTQRDAMLKDAVREPWHWAGTVDPEIEHAQTTTPNVMILIGNLPNYVATFDLNEVARRALTQILALRAWQLQHNSQFPQRLDAIVPAELPALPDDPFSGHDFLYIPSHGQEIPPLRSALMPTLEPGHAPTPGSWLLYSVGPDFGNDGGITFAPNHPRHRPVDVVFAIPPVESKPGATKDPRPDAAKNGPASPRSGH